MPKCVSKDRIKSILKQYKNKYANIGPYEVPAKSTGTYPLILASEPQPCRILLCHLLAAESVVKSNPPLMTSDAFTDIREILMDILPQLKKSAIRLINTFDITGTNSLYASPVWRCLKETSIDPTGYTHASMTEICIESRDIKDAMSLITTITKYAEQDSIPMFVFSVEFETYGYGILDTNNPPHFDGYP